MSHLTAAKKVLRFANIYGKHRTLFKVAGRSRVGIPLVWRSHPSPDVALIGCGQYGFATLGYFLTRRYGRRLRWCYDVDVKAAKTCSKALGIGRVASSPDEIMADPNVSFVYIASNHASHTDYAVDALNAGKDVYIEKPVAVSLEQLSRLQAAVLRNDSRIFAGYNRPFSGAIQYLRSMLPESPAGGVSLSCFVSGHRIPKNHWYREPQEGTRICGNAGHWIDLLVHVLAWRGLPDIFSMQLLSGDPDESDDNFSLSISSNHGDVFSLMLTSRCEPFEGINETINFQQGDVIAKIDDFRSMTIWRNNFIAKKRFKPKDVGHRDGTLQPFEGRRGRDWQEILVSTLLMLRIADMVRSGRASDRLSVQDELAHIGH